MQPFPRLPLSWARRISRSHAHPPARPSAASRRMMTISPPSTRLPSSFLSAPSSRRRPCSRWPATCAASRCSICPAATAPTRVPWRAPRRGLGDRHRPVERHGRARPCGGTRDAARHPLRGGRRCRSRRDRRLRPGRDQLPLQLCRDARAAPGLRPLRPCQPEARRPPCRHERQSAHRTRPLRLLCRAGLFAHPRGATARGRAHPLHLPHARRRQLRLRQFLAGARDLRIGVRRGGVRGLPLRRRNGRSFGRR